MSIDQRFNERRLVVLDYIFIFIFTYNIFEVIYTVIYIIRIFDFVITFHVQININKSLTWRNRIMGTDLSNTSNNLIYLFHNTMLIHVIAEHS